MEEMIRRAYLEERKGDRLEEVEKIRGYIRSAEVIVVPTRNREKLRAINDVLDEFNLSRAAMLEIDTSFSDRTRMPALFKAFMALDVCECDLVIARGRLGVPGSGAMLVVVDYKGRILTASLSPPHVIHGKGVYEIVKEEMRNALRRIGF